MEGAQSHQMSRDLFALRGFCPMFKSLIVFDCSLEQLLQGADPPTVISTREKRSEERFFLFITRGKLF